MNQKINERAFSHGSIIEDLKEVLVDISAAKETLALTPNTRRTEQAKTFLSTAEQCIREEIQEREKTKK